MRAEARKKREEKYKSIPIIQCVYVRMCMGIYSYIYALLVQRRVIAEAID